MKCEFLYLEGYTVYEVNLGKQLAKANRIWFTITSEPCNFKIYAAKLSQV
jgi:hypothetical protein